MVCPACGGTRSAPIAPGYVECTSIVVDRAFTGPLPDEGPPGPDYLDTARHCGRRYHVSQPIGAGPVVSCACGTFAIGLCVECGNAVCGDHSVFDQGRRVCAYHVQERQQAAAAHRADEEARAVAASKAVMAQFFAAFFAAMKTAGNPGLTKIWQRDPVSMKEYKRFTKPKWDAWLLGTVHRDAYPHHDTKVRTSTRVAVCPDRTWIDAGPCKIYKMDRWAGDAVEDNQNISAICCHRWSVSDAEVAEMLKLCAERNGVRIA